MSDEQTNFKVTDRRLFNADGTPRDLPPEEKREPSASATEEPVGTPSVTAEISARPQSEQVRAETSATTESAQDEDEEIPEAEDPANFVNFVMSIASNAASSLGMMEHPVTHKREVDLELAKHWIDTLGMLQQKTRGNLLPQEEKILEGLLADLRMQYVSLTDASSPKASRAYTGRDIIGG